MCVVSKIKVSKMTSVTAWALHIEEVACWSKVFQMRAAATGKARSLTVNSWVRPTISDEDERLLDYSVLISTPDIRPPPTLLAHISNKLLNICYAVMN